MAAEVDDRSIRYQIIPEEAISPQLDRQLVAYLSEIFPEWRDVFAKRRAWHDAPPVWTTLATEK